MSEKMPSERAFKAAVEMEIHAALSTRTDAKAREIDKHFPAYDDAIDAIRKARDLLEGDLVGTEWKRACAEFVATADDILSLVERRS